MYSTTTTIKAYGIQMASFLAFTGIFFTILPLKSQGMSIQELSTLSEKFISSISLPWHQHTSKTPQSIIYGHEQIGFYQAQSWQLSDNNQILLEFIAPTYRFPIKFYAILTSGEKKLLLTRLIKSPVPKIFLQNQREVVSGQLSYPFYLLNGALPRKLLIDPDYKSKRPEIFRKNHYRFTYLMIINRLGEIVWLHVPVIDGSLFSSYLSVKEVGEGFYGIMFGKHSGYFEIVKYTGVVARDFSSKDARVPFVMHHDYETLGAKKLFAVGNEKKDLYTFTKNPADKGKTFVSDTLIGIDLIKGTSQKLMSFTKRFHPGITPYITGDHPSDKKFVHWNTPKADFDFLHINSVDYIPSWNGVLVSFRNISKIGLLDSKFTEILWTLGSEQDTFTIKDPADQFRHQHTPLITSKNTLMLFDNGITQKESRIVEYLLDSSTAEAKLIWEFKPSPKLFSKDRSSVYPLTNNRFGVLFVTPIVGQQKKIALPHTDIYMEVDRQTKVKGIMTITYPVASPGYRMLPLVSISDDSATQLAQTP